MTSDLWQTLGHFAPPNVLNRIRQRKHWKYAHLKACGCVFQKLSQVFFYVTYEDRKTNPSSTISNLSKMLQIFLWRIDLAAIHLAFTLSGIWGFIVGGPSTSSLFRCKERFLVQILEHLPGNDW